MLCGFNYPSSIKDFIEDRTAFIKCLDKPMQHNNEKQNLYFTISQNSY